MKAEFRGPDRPTSRARNTAPASKNVHFHHLQVRATLTTILNTSQNPHVLHISRFPKIDTARRRERTSIKDLVGAPFRAGEMHFHDLEGNFSPRGSPKKPDPSAHTTDLHQVLFFCRKNPMVWPHCLGHNFPFGGNVLDIIPPLGGMRGIFFKKSPLGGNVLKIIPPPWGECS